MAERLTLFVEIKDLATAALRRLDGAIRGLLSPVGRVAAAFTNLRNIVAAAFVGVGIRQFTRTIGGLLRAGAEAERVYARVETQIRNVGVVFGEVERQQLGAFTDRLQTLTGISDEEIARVVGLLTSLTGDYRKALENTNLVLDLATALQMDYASAARLVANALQGDLTMLGRYLPELKVTNNEMLKTADASKRSAIGMDLLRQRIGGLAQNEAKTLAGQIALIQQLWGDFQEALGSAIGASLSASGVFGAVRDKIVDLKQWVQNNQAQIAEWTRQVVAAAQAGLEFVGVLAKIALGLKELVFPTDFERVEFGGAVRGARQQLERAQRGEISEAAARRAIGETLQLLGREWNRVVGEMRQDFRRAIESLAATGALTPEALRGLPGRLEAERLREGLRELPPVTGEDRMRIQRLAALLEAINQIATALGEFRGAIRAASEATISHVRILDGARLSLEQIRELTEEELSAIRVARPAPIEPERVPFIPPEALIRPAMPRPSLRGVLEPDLVAQEEITRRLNAQLEDFFQKTHEATRLKALEAEATAQLVSSMGVAAAQLISMFTGRGGPLSFLAGALGIAGGIAATLATGGAASPLLAAGLSAGASVLGAVAAATTREQAVRITAIDDAAARKIRPEEPRAIRETVVIVRDRDTNLDEVIRRVRQLERRDAITRGV